MVAAPILNKNMNRGLSHTVCPACPLPIAPELHMRSPLAFALAVTLSAAASADTFEVCNKNDRGLIGCTERTPKIRLVDYHGATPIPDSAPVPSPAPVIRGAGSSSLFLLGLSLVGAGLVLGAGGFAILLACHPATDTQPAAGCYSPTMTIVGWALAAPGILPLLTGAFILYFMSGGKSRAQLDPAPSAVRWVFSAMPLNGGGMVGAAATF